MRLLFITRTYPPLVGGMEKFANDFYRHYQKVGNIDLLANSGGKKTIIFFLVRTIIFLVINSRKYDVIHLYDAVLFPLIPVIRLFSKAKISFTVNGLDIVYSRFGYQSIMPFFLKNADKIIAISQYTKTQCALRGVAEEKLRVIPIGINFDVLKSCSEMKALEIFSKFNIPTGGKNILLTVGRLVKRKGHSWFIENVLKELPDNYIYVIVGDGPEKETISRQTQELGLADRVFILGKVSDEDKNCFYRISDLFIMPNISIENDQEGFGIVLLEAGRYGLPALASNIEGIRDAVIDGRTGRLLEEKDVNGFIETVLHPNIDRSNIAKTVDTHFDWVQIAEKYHQEFSITISENTEGIH